MCWLQHARYACGCSSPIRPAGYVVDPKTAWIPATGGKDAVRDQTEHPDNYITWCERFYQTRRFKYCLHQGPLETMPLDFYVFTDRVCEDCRQKKLEERRGVGDGQDVTDLGC